MNCVILWWWKTQLTRNTGSFLTWMHLSNLSRSLFLQCCTQVQSFVSPWTSIMPHDSSFPTQQPVWSSYNNSDGSSQKSPDSWTWCVRMSQSHLHCTHPTPTSAPSQLLHRHFLWSPGLWTRCHHCLVWSALSSSFHWLKCCLLWKAFSAFPLLDEGPSCSGSRKTFSIFYSIISHSVILASLFACLPE